MGTLLQIILLLIVFAGPSFLKTLLKSAGQTQSAESKGKRPASSHREARRLMQEMILEMYGENAASENNDNKCADEVSDFHTEYVKNEATADSPYFTYESADATSENVENDVDLTHSSSELFSQVEESVPFDLRQAVLYQTILERKYC